MSRAAPISRTFCGPRAAAGAICALVATVSPRASADEPRRSVAVELAAVGSSARDDLMVPLATTGGGLSIGGSYAGMHGPGMLDVGVRAGIGLGVDRVDSMGLVVEHGLGVRYLVPLRRLGVWRPAVGPVIGIDADIFHFGDWDDAHNYWVGTRWLGAATRGWRSIGHGWRLDVAGELGVLALVGRPPMAREHKQDPLDSLQYYLIDVHDRSELASPASWQHVRLRAELSRSRGESFVRGGWRVGTELRLVRTDEPVTAFAVQLKLVAARSWRW